MRKNILRAFVCVMRIEEMEAVRIIMEMKAEREKGQGRLKNRCLFGCD